MGEIGERVKGFILREYLPDVDPVELTYDTELLRSGILDSLATLRLRAWLEDEHDIRLEGHELDFDHFGTIADIERLVESKVVREGSAGR